MEAKRKQKIEENYNENKTALIIGVIFLLFTFSACNFSTANISELKFGKNRIAIPAATGFIIGEKAFVVAVVSKAKGKHNMNFNMKY